MIINNVGVASETEARGAGSRAPKDTCFVQKEAPRHTSRLVVAMRG